MSHMNESCHELQTTAAGLWQICETMALPAIFIIPAPTKSMRERESERERKREREKVRERESEGERKQEGEKVIPAPTKSMTERK